MFKGWNVVFCIMLALSVVIMIVSIFQDDYSKATFFLIAGGMNALGIKLPNGGRPWI